nr:hypothetical protein StreXyl84_44980 [Streptomyces sp. Xyl84]
METSTLPETCSDSPGSAPCGGGGTDGGMGDPPVPAVPAAAAVVGTPGVSDMPALPCPSPAMKTSRRSRDLFHRHRCVPVWPVESPLRARRSGGFGEKVWRGSA